MKPAPDAIAHLNADTDLNPETAAALARMIRLAHHAAIRGDLTLTHDDHIDAEERDAFDADRDTASDLAREQGAP